MSKILLYVLLLGSAGFVSASPSMIRVDATTFVNGGREDFESIFKNDPAKLKQSVKQLFDQETILHAGTRGYDLEASFEAYYRLQQNQYHLVDLNQDGTDEVIFNGYINPNDDMEYLEIFAIKNGKFEVVHQEVGHILAFKIHPNTGEIVLFQHKYPCCNARSHNIYQLRLIAGVIQVHTKYFLGRDSDMKGTFFPQEVKYGPKYKTLEKNTLVRWSKEIIEKGAAPDAPTNAIIHYPAGTRYKLLASENGFDYVLLCGPPVIETSLVVNAENLSKMHLFAWIKH
jgi:hypothetical protein